MFLNLVIDGRPGIEKEAGWKPGNMGNAGAGVGLVCGRR